jgi:2-dehydro-3-deoxyphosphogluconate aldolase/(4S)-4-hydroxy-2-oxoglutarate aldolase
MKELEKCPVLGILRGIKSQHIEPLAEASISAGLRAMEVTMNTPGAHELISTLNEIVKGQIHVGAGTVTSIPELEVALKAGAEFIVMPALVEEVVKECIKQGIPVFPGALTPTEILKAWELGATMVKVFPASAFGPKYLKDMKGPLNEIKLMAVGGVSAENISDFFNCGASAVAFGASIFNMDLIETGNYDKIQILIKDLLSGYYTWLEKK